MIDYMIGNRKVKERVERLEIEEKVDSDHHPVVVWVKGRRKGKKG